jgi:hypothetical protein
VHVCFWSHSLEIAFLDLLARPETQLQLDILPEELHPSPRPLRQLHMSCQRLQVLQFTPACKWIVTHLWGFVCELALFPGLGTAACLLLFTSFDAGVVDALETFSCKREQRDADHLRG